VSQYIDTVSQVLRHRPVDFLPKGELFISSDFLDHFFCKLKGEYVRQVKSAAEKLGLSLIGIDFSPQWSQSLLQTRQYKILENYFSVGCIPGPMAGLIESQGFFNVFLNMKKNPSLFSNSAGTLLKDVEKKTKEARDNGFSAVAVTDDIAGNKGLFFSLNDFMEIVRPIYQQMAHIIKGNDLYAFFHSDGDITEIIPSLIEAGYDCIHPIDTQAGLDLYALEKKFGRETTFMGHIDLLAWNEDRITQEIHRAEKEFKNGGLILGSAGGLSLETTEDKLGMLYHHWKLKEPHP
jgi:uroporphyrinogen decarboxylase